MRKNLLITGASRGIGRATAVMAAARGYAVGVNYRTQADAANDTVARIQSLGGQALAVAGDVSLETDVASMFDAVERAFGSLDAVVINAGIVAPKSLLADMSVERLRKMLDVNVLGAFLCAREAARRLSRTRGGHGGNIVFVSSIAARLGSPGEYVDYAASKGAVDTLTLGLGKELAAEGVRVNAVRPGVIATEIHETSGQPGRAERVGRTAPLERHGEPDEVAEAILWLLSDAASYVTGTLLDVAGGR